MSLATVFFACGKAQIISFPEGTREGFLPNGLHYIVRHNSSPAHTTEFRLVMQVGSINETDEQRGGAHFLEHMAFNGSTHFPDQQAVNYFERIGMRYGRDINAYTGFDKTVYLYSVPMTSADTAVVDTTLRIMADCLSELVIDPQLTESERGIILEELRDYQTGDEFYQLKIGTGIHSRHLPLGLAEDIEHTTAHALRHFYKKWYSPSRATIIVVGDINVNDTEHRIRQIFGHHTGMDANPESANLQVQLVRYVMPELTYEPGITLQVCTDSLTTKPYVELIVPHRACLARDLDAARQKYMQKLLVESLRIYARECNLQVAFLNHWYLANTEHFVMKFSADNRKQILNYVAEVVSLLHYVSQNGVGDHILAEAKTATLRQLRRGPAEKSSEEYCEDFIDDVITADRNLSSSLDVELLCQRLETVSPTDLKPILHEWLTDLQHTLLVAYKHDGNKNTCLSKSDIQKAIHRGWRTKNSWNTAETSLARNVDTPPHNPPSPAPSALRAVSVSDDSISPTRVYEQLNLREYHLDNGIRLFIRPTLPSPDSLVYMAAHGRGGTADLPDSLYHRLSPSVGYVDMGAVEGVDTDSLGAFLFDTGMSLSLYESDYWHDMLGMTPLSHAAEFFKLIQLRTSSPKLNYPDFEEYRNSEITSFGHESTLSKMLSRSPERQLSMFRDSLMGTVPELRRPRMSVADLQSLSLDEMAERFHTLFASPANFVYILCGTIPSPDHLAATFASVLGQSANSADMPPITSNASRFTFLPTPIHRAFPSDNPSRSSLDYILPGHYQPSLRHTLMLKLLRDILQNRLISSLRTDANIVYSPYANVNYTGHPACTFYFDLSIAVDTTNLQQADSLIRRLIADVADHPVAADELDAIKASFLASKQKALSDDAPSTWRNTLGDLYKNGVQYADFDRYAEILADISPQDLSEFFRSATSLQSLSVLSIGMTVPLSTLNLTSKSSKRME